MKKGDNPVQLIFRYMSLKKTIEIFVFLVNQKNILLEYSKTTY